MKDSKTHATRDIDFGGQHIDAFNDRDATVMGYGE
jgi:hypothetical protein